MDSQHNSQMDMASTMVHGFKRKSSSNSTAAGITRSEIGTQKIR